jgi:hypothetical protein
MNKYERAFHNALAAIRKAVDDPTWRPTNQPKTTALSWAIGLELASPETRWVYSCWGSDSPLKARVLDIYGVRHRRAGSKGLPELRGAGKIFYPRQYLVDFSAYPTRGNKMLLALESEACARHGVGSSEVDPEYDYNWDFAKLLYLPADLRVFVARVVEQKRRAQLWEDLAGILQAGRGAFLLECPIVVYILPTKAKDASEVGVWDGREWTRKSLGPWHQP